MQDPDRQPRLVPPSTPNPVPEVQPSEGRITDIFAVLLRLRFSEAEPRRRWWKVPELLTGIAMLLLLAGAVLAHRTGHENTGLVLGFLFVLVPVLYTIYSFVGMLKFLLPVIGAPTKYLLHQATERVETKRRAMADLRTFPFELRRAAETALAAEIKGIESRTTLLVGVIEKTGLLPAAVALYLGYVAYLKNVDRSDFGDALFIAAALLYAAAFFIGAWRQSVEDQLWLLQQVNEEESRVSAADSGPTGA